jgi:hypothetical protein
VGRGCELRISVQPGIDLMLSLVSPGSDVCSMLIQLGFFGTGEGNCDTALRSGQGQQGTSELSHSSKEGEASEDP